MPSQLDVRGDQSSGSISNAGLKACPPRAECFHNHWQLRRTEDASGRSRAAVPIVVCCLRNRFRSYLKFASKLKLCWGTPEDDNPADRYLLHCLRQRLTSLEPKELGQKGCLLHEHAQAPQSKCRDIPRRRGCCQSYEDLQSGVAATVEFEHAFGERVKVLSAWSQLWTLADCTVKQLDLDIAGEAARKPAGRI